MAACGVVLICVPASSDGGGMEAAGDLATRMQMQSSFSSTLNTCWAALTNPSDHSMKPMNCQTAKPP